MKLLFVLILIGMQQTLVLAILPELQVLPPFSGETDNISLLVFATQTNLLGFWLCSPFWGKWLQRHVVTNKLIVGLLLALALCHFLFWWTVNVEAGWGWMSLSRFFLGVFSSAFLPLAHGGYLQGSDHSATSMKNIGKYSALLTLGRLIGPLPALIPVSLDLKLLLPCIAALLFTAAALRLTLQRPLQRPKEIKQLADTPQKSSINAQGHLCFIYSVIAILMTAWVAIIQYELIPRFGKINSTSLHLFGENISLFSISLLWMGISVLITQRWLLPTFKTPSLKGVSVIGSLYGAGLIFWWWTFDWPNNIQFFGLILSLTCFAIGIPLTTAFYTFCALNQTQSPAERVLVSGRLNRFHTTGHLLGMGLTVIFAQYFELMQLLISLFTLMILVLIFAVCRPWLQKAEFFQASS